METTNNRNAWIIGGVIAALVLVGGVYAYYRSITNETGGTAIQETETQEEHELAVAQYIRANIATLSPEPAVLGGTLQVTNIDFIGEREGVATYEDGHNLFAGRFTYEIGEDGAVNITSFDVDSNFDAKG
jgi:hypothetical protein